MLKLFKNAEIYAPKYIGRQDILVAYDKILLIEENIEIKNFKNVEVYNLEGLRIAPGLIDAHIHIAGAGGEGGPATRTPELRPSQLVEAGITTVVGCLGTDGITRTAESVLMKAKSLRLQGFSAYMYTGSYQVPTPTITGSVAKDLAIIDEVIGVGEIALSDHRSSFPTTSQLIQLVAQCRIGAMMGAKSGIVNIHMGDAQNPFNPIYNVVENSEIKLTQFLPTHCNRNPYILEDAKTYGKKGFVDITTSAYPYFPDEEIKPSKAISELLISGVPIEHITMTSDACGSLPSFDQNGNLLRLESGSPATIWKEIQDLVIVENMQLTDALMFATSNIAKILKLHNKGTIDIGKYADFIAFDSSFDIKYFISNGQIMMENKIFRKKFNFE